MQLLRDLLPVLSYLHRSGVVHRDISPDNIILRSHDKLPVLIDLGGVKQIAMNVAYQLAGGKATSTHTRLGKLGYAPDEQMRLGHVAPYSDLYALGVTAVVLMTGKQPQELIDPHTMEWIWEKQLSISYQTRRILNRMLANQPAKRFQSADEILQIIESGGFVEDSSYSLIAPPEVEPVPPKKPKLVAVSAIKTIFTNNSGQGAILDNSLKVPPEIKGWNWGAFFLPGVWCITNRVWIGLLAWTDPTLIMSLALPWLIMGVILGVKGNEWAWKSRKWESIAAFRAHQRAWAIVSFILIGLLLFCLLWIGLIVFVWLGSIGR